MELGFIFSALRRYLWLVAACMVLGMLPGLMSGGGPPRYESLGVLQVVPPADAIAYAGNPDRYVVGQISVLNSTTLAEAVAAGIPGSAASVVGSLVEFEQLPETDIVRVRVRSDNAEFSQQIVNGYLDQYVLMLEQQVASAQQPIDEQIAATESALDDVDEQISQAMAPYLEVTPAPGDAYPPIPGIDQVAPSLASSQSLLRSTLVGLQQDRTRVRSNSRVEGVVVERSTLASMPIAESNRLLVAAGGVAGAFVGLLLAIATARLSPRVLDDLHVEEILGRQPFGTFPYASALAGALQTAVERPPESITPFVESLCVRIEASGRPGEPMTVLVTGAERGLGTTTLAAILANGFAAAGSQVLLVDADRQHPSLTSLTRESATPRSSRARALQRLTATAHAGLRVATLNADRPANVQRRRHLGESLTEAMNLAEITVLDGGTLLDSSSTLELARRCDCVVLVLAPHQRSKPLTTVAEELGEIQPIPVWSKTRGPVWRRLLDYLGMGAAARRTHGLDSVPVPPAAAPAELVPSATGGSETSRDGEQSP